MNKLIIPTLIGTVGIVLMAGCNKETKPSEVHARVGWTSSQVAAAESVEGAVAGGGQKWTKIAGEITVGSYVQDILEGRQGQPQGRGAIGTVTSISRGSNGLLAASVDFGHGYLVDIYFAELSLVNIE